MRGSQHVLCKSVAPSFSPLLRQAPLQQQRKLDRKHLFHSPAARSFSTKSKKFKAGEMAPNIGVILGTMTFGWSYSSSSIDSKLAGQMVDAYFNAGYNHIDTALTYSGGKTEKIIGELMPAGSDRAAKCGVLATKAGPWEGTATMSGNGGLAPLQLRAKVEASLSSLNAHKIDLLYLHAPDSATRIEETLAEVHKLHTEGKIGALGLSNFQAWEVADIYHTCKANGYVLPSVYQGMYNAVTRQVEAELLPCLRKLNMSFYVYNPLAGGILTDRFWKDSYFDAADSLVEACQEQGDIEAVEAAMRWLKHHSHLKDGDAVVIGASSLEQLESNLAALKSTAPLPDQVVKVLDSAWSKCQPDCPSYERGHSKI